MLKEYIEREALKEDLKESYDRLKAIYDGLTYDEDKQICAGQLTTFTEAILMVKEAPAADVAPVRHGRCDVCSGKAVLTQDCYNGYSIEIDAEQQELSIWQGDKCLAYFHIDYCPNCGAKMDKEEE